LHYIQTTIFFGIHINRGDSLPLRGFTNANWADNVNDRKSTSGYLMFLGFTPISWKSEKQHTVNLPSIKAEYKTLVYGTTEIFWIRSLLLELRLLFFFSTTTL